MKPLIVDADGHVCEPVDLWEARLPAALRERGPRVRWNEAEQCQQVLVEDRVGVISFDPGERSADAQAALYGRNALRLYGIEALAPQAARA